MTFAEAKARDDYKFRLNGVQSFLHDLRTGEFMNWTDFDKRDGYFNYGMAVLEIGNVDIELNINAMCSDDGCDYINAPDPCYFLCVKGTGTENLEVAIYFEYWNDAGYLDNFGYEVSVNWWADDWIEQLERDMFENLMKVVKEFDLKIDEYNFVGEEHQWDVFNKLHGTVR